MTETTRTNLNVDLTDQELDALDDFLACPALEDSAMDVSTLEGFLTALAIGPRTVLPSEWMPWIWDMDAGEAAPEFESMDEANRVLSLIMRHYNAVVRQFNADPTGFEPIYWFGGQWGAAEWCEGFLLGMKFDREAWSLLMVAEPSWFAPFTRLGTDVGIELIKKDGDGDRWMTELVPSLVKIHAFWQEKRAAQPQGFTSGTLSFGKGPPPQVVRNAPKVGRNEPCPCGSGKKYKKCCGARNSTLH